MFRFSVRTALTFIPALTLLALSSCEPATGEMPTGIDYVRVMWNGDASREATIAWAVPTDTKSKTKLYYSVTDHGTDTTRYENVANASITRNENEVFHSYVRLKNLTPQTRYNFVISDGTRTSARFWFKTASDRIDERFSFISGGDSRDSRTVRQQANQLVAKLRADAVFFNGDMTAMDAHEEWRDWFQDWQLTISPDGRVTPLVVSRGNHESSNKILVNLFDTPSDVHYTVKIGGDLIRLYTLNSEASIAGKQTAWLRGELERDDPKIIWQMAQYHTPMRPHVGSKSDGANQYKHWAPLFHQYSVNLVMESDSHSVKQTWPIRPTSERGSTEGFIRDDKTGSVYIGEGGWGAPLRKANKVRPWTRDSGSFNHFNLLFVSEREIEIRTVKVGDSSAIPSVTEEDRFNLPKELPLWAPANGSIVKITR